ncbi:uncharacterized protein LOC141906157 isoform X2 [Tubulanus polymorphus]|uniref:uncharacterized protein LOC141906157 isoform X2 n=1 Tax=Tubulanus polymorphus TaxID=672921 RepID=UPI003DA4E3E9
MSKIEDENSSSDFKQIVKFFHGSLQTKVICRSCSTESTQTDGFTNLSLSLGKDKGKGVTTLVSLLNSYFCSEELDDYECSHCKLKVARKSTKPLKAPECLAIQINRFSKTLEKRNDFVRFDEVLSFHNENFKLCSVVVHQGSSLEGGHYISFVCDIDGKWFETNDSKVLRANKDWVLSQNAYMLFYIKVPTRTTADNSHQPDPQTRTTAHNSHQPDPQTRTTADNSHQPDPQVCETFYTSPSRPCMCL